MTRILPFGLIECTTLGMLTDRVAALRRVNVYEPHTYAHHISRARRHRSRDGAFDARSLLVVRTSVGGEIAFRRFTRT